MTDIGWCWRDATAVERADAKEFVNEQTAAYASAAKKDAESQAIVDFCQALLSLNEFVYVE